ncbi:ATPase involved in DNA repair [Chlamydia poikilotherma]|uniref:ATPase involved in DNA repair n=1 Tax=Chlamydia poikilotherma TaxID=1967783 RepID=A0A3B0PSR0_9CHLA|nr:ATPase involved in DNA repair [Chlamydia poikilotherma]
MGFEAMHVFNKHLYQKVYQGFRWETLLGRYRSFSIEWVFLSSIVLIFGGLGCASIVDTTLLLLIMCFSILALVASIYFRFWGYGVVSCLFLFVYYYKHIGTCSSLLWALGLSTAFLLSWGIFVLGITLIDEENQEQKQKYDQLSNQYAEIQVSYDKAVHDKAMACEFLEKRAHALESELQESRTLLQDSCKKQEHMALDLQILADQKNSWLEDYAILHNEYVRLVAGDETTSVFSWVSGKETFSNSEGRSEDAELWLRALHEKDEKMASLENELIEEKLSRKSLENECHSLKSDIEEIDQLRSRLEEFQNLLSQKDKELTQLHALVNQQKALVKTPVADEFKSYKDKYLQLKMQFAEKTEALAEVRKELFLVREDYLALQKQEEMTSNFVDMKDIEMIQNLLAHIECLEEEITSLEGLISHNLSQ